MLYQIMNKWKGQQINNSVTVQALWSLMVSSRPLTVSAAFWLISVEPGWAWAADGWVICCCSDTGSWPEAGLLGEGWAVGCGAWPACLRRAGRWGGAGLDGVCAACWEVALTTEGGVVCCWTVGCACGWTSALVTGDTAVAAVVSAPVAAAGCTVDHTKTDESTTVSKGQMCKSCSNDKTNESSRSKKQMWIYKLFSLSLNLCIFFTIN